MASANIRSKWKLAQSGFSGGSPVDALGIGSGKSVALQFDTRLPADAVISAASLVYSAHSDSAATPGATLGVAAVSFGSDRVGDTSVLSASVLGSVTGLDDSGAWTAGESRTLDITSAAQAAVAVDDRVTLLLSQAGASVDRRMLGFGDRYGWLDAPRISVTYDYTPTERDPLSLIFDGVWALLESDAEFCRLVKPGNRVKFNAGERKPDVDVAQAADYPRASVRVFSFAPGAHATSSSSTLDMSVAVDVVCGDRRLSEFLPIVFRVYAALANMLHTVQAMRWAGQEFCLEVDQTTSVAGLDQTLLNKGVAGWATIWQANVKMIFDNTRLQG